MHSADDSWRHASRVQVGRVFVFVAAAAGAVVVEILVVVTVVAYLLLNSFQSEQIDHNQKWAGKRIHIILGLSYKGKQRNGQCYLFNSI